MPEPIKELTREELKQATKEAIREWMDEKFVLVGTWSMKTLLVGAIVALTYFILGVNGWHHK